MTKPLPLLAKFKSDGCTMWPDGEYRSCCEAHDRAYWTGGTARQRAAADRLLFDCVAEARGRRMAWIMWIGVRVGAASIWPVHWRWGFGHPWPRSKPPRP